MTNHSCVVSLERLELSTPRLKALCSNQLSYRPTMVVSVRLELTTPALSERCSNQLSYETVWWR